MPIFKNQRGVVPMALLAIGFLVVSLVSITAATNNPLKSFALTSWARVSGTANANRAERQALREGGDKWTVADTGKQCVGSECLKILQNTDNNPNNDIVNADGTKTISVAQQKASEAPSQQDALKAQCEADKAAGKGNYICDTSAGLQEYAATAPQEKFQSLVKQCEADKAAGKGNYICNTAGGLQEYGITSVQQKSSEETNQLRSSCEVAVSLGKGNYICDTPAGLQEYSATSTQQQVQDLVKQCEADKAAGKGNYVCNTAGGLQEYSITSAQQRAQSGGFPQLQAKPIPGITAPAPKIQAVPYIVTINAPSFTDCIKASAGRYYAFFEGKCTISTATLSGISAEELKNLYTKSVPAITESLCSLYAKNGDVKAEFKNGICTISAITPPAPPVVVAPAKIATETYFNFAIGKYSANDKLLIQNACNTTWNRTCDSNDLGEFSMFQLQQLSPTLFNQAYPIHYPNMAPQAPVTQPANPTAGNYSQNDYGNIVIPNTKGQTLSDLGCGIIADTNLLNLYGGKNYNPKQVLDMIPANRWSPNGLSGVQDGEFGKILTDNGFKFETSYARVENLWSRVEPNQIVWLAGYTNGTKGKNIQHITYMIPTDEKDTFLLQTNDYFGSNMKCKPSGNNSLECSNLAGDKMTFALDNDTHTQAVYKVTPPNK